MSRQILSAFQYTNSGQSTGSPQRFGNQSVGQPSNFPRGPIAPEGVQVSQDGRPTRRIVIRKTVDYNGPLFRYEESRPLRNALGGLSGSCSSSTLANSSSRGLMCALQPDPLFAADLPLPRSLPEAPINALCLKHVRTATNKIRSPINALVWTPDGRRVITGANSGEFTLWNGLNFGFETILQAHDSPVRSIVWSNNKQWLVSGDHYGYVKYWQINMNNVKMFQAHKDSIRGISFSPTDNKLATCADDSTVRVWDFWRCEEERVLRGHGADVRAVQWHPSASLLASGSRDPQQPIKLWDPRSGRALVTVYAHKTTCQDLRWNAVRTNWLLTASRDRTLKLFDLRHLAHELQTFKGHKKEVFCLAWHPNHESLFASGGADGALYYWLVGHDRAAGCVEDAHDKEVACLDWHPLGHLLATGGHDLTTKFWIRNRPGDGLVSQLQRGAGAEEEAEQVELAEPGFGSATSALSSAGAPAKRAKAGGARGSLPELVSRLASVLPMARTLPHLRALLSEQQQQKAGAAESSTVSAGAAGEQHATDVKRVKLAAPAIPGLDLVPSEGFGGDAASLRPSEFGVQAFPEECAEDTRFSRERRTFFTGRVPREFQRQWEVRPASPKGPDILSSASDTAIGDREQQAASSADSAASGRGQYAPSAETTFEKRTAELFEEADRFPQPPRPPNRFERENAEFGERQSGHSQRFPGPREFEMADQYGARPFGPAPGGPPFGHPSGGCQPARFRPPLGPPTSGHFDTPFHPFGPNDYAELQMPIGPSTGSPFAYDDAAGPPYQSEWGGPRAPFPGAPRGGFQEANWSQGPAHRMPVDEFGAWRGDREFGDWERRGGPRRGRFPH